jgi:hypothetical protein
MINKDLFIFHDDNGSIVDLTNDLRDYIRDDSTVDFVAAEDRLYIGLYKPFNQLYAEMTTAQVEGAELSFEISDGSGGWVALDVVDESKSFSRSGFILWDRNNSSWASQDISGEDLYWIRVTADIDFSAVFRGLNTLFADDNDLLAESPRIEKFYPKDETSFVKYHVAARNSIIQRLRNGGNVKKDTSVGTSDFFVAISFGLNVPIKEITKWDILEAGEIREAAKHLALAKIYLDNSKNVDDKEYQRYRDSLNDYGDAFQLFYMSLDFNDDGLTDADEEQLQINDITVHKV